MNLIDLDDYIQDKFLGHGGFAEVYKVQEKHTKKYYAAKIFKDILKPDDVRSLKREIKNMDKLHHPSIVRFFGLSEENFNGEKKPTLIIEYLPNGSLGDILNIERNSLSPKDWNATKKLINIYGIASGLSYLHSKSIIHRDLKPANILMDESLFPKIADFGLSKDLDDSSQSIKATKGTPGYIAPEVWYQQPYSFPVDVYAFAFIVYEIVTNKIPYENLKMPQIFVKLVRRERPPIDQTVSKSYRHLIEKCWKQEQSQRPTFDDIVKLLETDEGFITPEIDRDEYYDYIDYIKNGNKNLNSMTFNQIIIDKEAINRIINGKYKENREDQESESDTEKSDTRQGEKEEKSDTKIEKKEEQENRIKIEEKEEENLIKIEEKEEETKSDIKNEKEENGTNSDVDLLKQMADDGDAESMFFYARLCYFGTNVPLDKEKAAYYFQKAADLGHVSSMNFFGKMLFNGDGIPKDLEKSSHYFKKASDLGDLDAMNNYAILIYNGYAIEKNKKEAARLFKEASDQGNLKAMNNYANILYGGNGVPMNKQKAADYYKQAADLGYPPAMNNYANMLLTGDTVQKDEALALQYYERAADQGFGLAAYNYALLLEKGDLIKLDYDEVIRYLKIAADKNHKLACYRYGQILMKQGLSDEANKYFEVAAKKGHLDAQFCYGRNLYLDKESDQQMKEDGINLIETSAKKGNKKADLLLNLLNLKNSFECNIC